MAGEQVIKKKLRIKILWVQLDSLTAQLKINWIWVKGHSGHSENDRADYLANQGVGMEGPHHEANIFRYRDNWLDPNQGHRIIEIAAVEMNNRQLTTNHYHTYLNPGRNIDPAAQEVHGITLEFLQDKPFLKILH